MLELLRGRTVQTRLVSLSGVGAMGTTEGGRWVGLSDNIGLLLAQPGGSPVGFQLKALSKFGEQAETADEVWHGPHFHAPQVGLEDASIGETGEARAAYERACEIEVADGEDADETDAAKLLVGLDGD